jgi:membrane-bound lytic murein transglycosylase D
VRTLWPFIVLLASARLLLAQDDSFTLDPDLMRSAEQWARENLDEDALRVLDNMDQDQVRKVLARVQKEFHGEYVIDLAQLKSAVSATLPLLEKYEETYPYALWLRTRFDYLEVADQFRLIIPPPKVEPGRPARPAPNPPAPREREIWARKVSDRPWPPNSKAYVQKLKPIFTAERVPPELVWLAEIESSFDPRARSPQGAAGLFQLMPATARRFGLTTTWPLDQRLTPEPSARAAAKYLRILHARFKEWRLTLAAYNAGEGTVQELLTRHKAQSFDEISTRLPSETQFYVPKFEATLLRREGLKLSQLRVPAAAPEM